MSPKKARARSSNNIKSMSGAMLLGLRASPGPPWRPCWDGALKNHKKVNVCDPLFGAYLNRYAYFLGNVFLLCFLKPTFATSLPTAFVVAAPFSVLYIFLFCECFFNLPFMKPIELDQTVALLNLDTH